MFNKNPRDAAIPLVKVSCFYKYLKNIFMPYIFYVRIKKNYASAVIKDLQKLDAIELLEEAPIPNWQKKRTQ